jgi:hypothetical protein
MPQEELSSVLRRMKVSDIGQLSLQAASGNRKNRGIDWCFRFIVEDSYISVSLPRKGR